MRLLLDTHVLIWSITRPDRLSETASGEIERVENAKFFSAASIWEIAIKRSLKRPDFDIDPDRLRVTGLLDFVELPVTGEVAARVADLPMHHRDPFDRLLVAQAIDIDARLLTVDAALAAYGPHVLMVA